MADTLYLTGFRSPEGKNIVIIDRVSQRKIKKVEETVVNLNSTVESANLRITQNEASLAEIDNKIVQIKNDIENIKISADSVPKNLKTLESVHATDVDREKAGIYVDNNGTPCRMNLADIPIIETSDGSSNHFKYEFVK